MPTPHEETLYQAAMDSLTIDLQALLKDTPGALKTVTRYRLLARTAKYDYLEVEYRTDSSDRVYRVNSKGERQLLTTIGHPYVRMLALSGILIQSEEPA